MTRTDTKYSKPGTPEELAEATTRHAFEEADADHNGTLSYDEFKKWYGNTAYDGEDEFETPLESPSSKVAKSVKKFESIAAQSLRDTMSLDDMRRITCLGSLHIREAVSRFADVCDVDGTITRSSFFKVLTDLSRASSQDEQLRIVLGNLYQIFDIDRNSIVDHAELVASLCVLCEGTSDEKAKIAFEAFTYVVFERSLNRPLSMLSLAHGLSFEIISIERFHFF